MEGAATTVYAQGGRGNARLVAWEGERTVTFTMEDALISPMGFSILTGAGLIDASSEKPMIVHKTEQVQVARINKDSNSNITSVEINLSEQPYVGKANPVGVNTYIKAPGSFDTTNKTTYYTREEYLLRPGVTEDNFDILKSTLFKKDGNDYTSVANDNYEEIAYYIKKINYQKVDNPTVTDFNNNKYYVKQSQEEGYNINDAEDFIYVMRLDDNGEVDSEPYIASEVSISSTENGKYTITLLTNDGESDINTTKVGGTTSVANNRTNDLKKFTANSIVLVDYYVKRTSGAFQVDITPDKFGGNFYLEASTLFRGTNGVDMPAEFIIPNCKIQSNFTFTMASSGDPSTFTFTMDAFPDYTRWDRTKKVYAAIQVLEESDTLADFERLGTPHGQNSAYNTDQKPWIEI